MFNLKYNQPNYQKKKNKMLNSKIIKVNNEDPNILEDNQKTQEQESHKQINDIAIEHQFAFIANNIFDM